MSNILKRLGGKFQSKGLPNIGKAIIKAGGAAIARTPVGGVLDSIGVLDAVGEALGVDSAPESIENKIDAMTPEQVQALTRVKELETEMFVAELEHDAALESERSRRHETDMKSDSALSKNIRPAMLIALVALASIYSYTVLILMLTDSFQSLDEWRKTLISEGQAQFWTAAGGALLFYFTLREAGKGIINWKAK